jgi:hypothetical protein
MYQMLDPGFVGLIFSVFNDDANGSRAGRVQVGKEGGYATHCDHYILAPTQTRARSVFPDSPG